MQISLCMLVKDEEKCIAECLSPIRDLFDDVLIVDTGSTDRTRELLLDCFGISAFGARLEERLCYGGVEVRNWLIARAKHPWVLFLDADERITREQARAVLDRAEDPGVSGYFSAWDTAIDSSLIEDYKLSLFRRDVRYSGLIHENTQQYLRRHGLRGAWQDDLAIFHCPETAKLAAKRKRYRWRLQCALSHDDTWYRYHWFLGYMLYRAGEPDEAARHLARAASSRSRDFPVECLNSHVVLASLHAGRGDALATASVLASALSFYEETAGDFEVEVNFRLKPWLDAALTFCRDGALERIRTYDFGH